MEKEDKEKEEWSNQLNEKIEEKPDSEIEKLPEDDDDEDFETD